jgi:hypothetical protein
LTYLTYHATRCLAQIEELKRELAFNIPQYHGAGEVMSAASRNQIQSQVTERDKRYVHSASTKTLSQEVVSDVTYHALYYRRMMMILAKYIQAIQQLFKSYFAVLTDKVVV